METDLEWKNVVVVGAGGALGALARYGISLWANTRFETPFPTGTFTINVSGSFAIGLIASLSMGFAWNEQARLFITMGFLGAFTTFSTFEYETLLLVMNGKRMGIALGYVAASIIVGLGAVALGFALGKTIAGSRMHAA
jgi:CrcB protein